MAHQADFHRIKLRNQIQKQEESLGELMEDIQQLARLAYLDAAPAMLELLVKDQLIDSLTDEDTKLRIRQNRAASSGGCIGARVLLVGKQATCNISPFSAT